MLVVRFFVLDVNGKWRRPFIWRLLIPRCCFRHHRISEKGQSALCCVRHRLYKDYIQITLYNYVYLQSETSGLAAQSACSRPIYPNLPYSPYSSPNSSPRWAASPHSSKQSWYPVFRVRRRPLKVTKQASTEHRDNYMQVNVIQFHSLCQAVTKCMNEHLNFIVCL